MDLSFSIKLYMELSVMCFTLSKLGFIAAENSFPTRLSNILKFKFFRTNLSILSEDYSAQVAVKQMQFAFLTNF